MSANFPSTGVNNHASEYYGGSNVPPPFGRSMYNNSDASNGGMAEHQQHHRFAGYPPGNTPYSSLDGNTASYAGNILPLSNLSEQQTPPHYTNNSLPAGHIQDPNHHPMSPPMYRSTGAGQRDSIPVGGRSQWVRNMQGMSGGSVVEGPSQDPVSRVDNGGQGPGMSGDFNRFGLFDNQNSKAVEAVTNDRLHPPQSSTLKSDVHLFSPGGVGSGEMTIPEVALAGDIGKGVLGTGPLGDSVRPLSNVSQASLRGRNL